MRNKQPREAARILKMLGYGYLSSTVLGNAVRVYASAVPLSPLEAADAWIEARDAARRIVEGINRRYDRRQVAPVL